MEKLVEKLTERGWSPEEAETIAKSISTTPFLVVASKGYVTPVDWQVAHNLAEAREWRERFLAREGVVTSEIYQLTIEPVPYELM